MKPSKCKQHDKHQMMKGYLGGNPVTQKVTSRNVKTEVKSTTTTTTSSQSSSVASQTSRISSLTSCSSSQAT